MLGHLWKERLAPLNDVHKATTRLWPVGREMKKAAGRGSGPKDARFTGKGGALHGAERLQCRGWTNITGRGSWSAGGGTIPHEVQRRWFLGTPSRKGSGENKRLVWSGAHNSGPCRQSGDGSIRSKASAVPALGEPLSPHVDLAALFGDGSAMRENKRPRCMQPPERETASAAVAREMCHRDNTKQPRRQMCSAQCRRSVADGRACLECTRAQLHNIKHGGRARRCTLGKPSCPGVAGPDPCNGGARSQCPIRLACQPFRNISAPHLLLVPGRSFSPQLTLS
jgi:hypothetical protein